MPNDSYIVKRSLLISFIERYANTCMQFASVMVLARLLTPEDIGIYTVGLAIIGIAHMIRDFGIGKYLVQEKELTREKVAAALGLTITLAWTLGIIVFIAAPYAADFYKEEGVKQVVHVVALNFFLIPLGAMTPALLKRSMSFGTLFKINLSSTFWSVVVGISLAYAGFGYMSMAWASVTNVAASAILAQYFLPSKYRVFPSLKNSRKIMGFGWHVVGANLAQELGNSALDLLVGKVLGFATLGFLSRGQGFVKIYQNVIAKAIEPVIAAHLSKTYRSGKRLDDSYLNTVTYTTLVGWFFLGFMGLMSFHMIRILYGDQWDTAAPIASLLCLGLCMGIPSTLARGLLVSTGNVRINFRLTLIFVTLRIILIVSLVHKGLYPLLLSFLVLSASNFLVTHFVVFRKFGFQKMMFFRAVFRNLLIVLIALLLPAYFWFATKPEGFTIVTELLLAGSVAFASWLGLIYLFKHPIRVEMNSLFNNVVSRVRGATLS